MKDRDITRNYHGGADTSDLAFNETPKEVRNQARIKVLRVIQAARSGLTCEEVEKAIGMSHQTASARITELVAGLLIKDSGARRKTKSGRLARVYVVR